MTTPEKDLGLPPEAEARLDGLLAAWAERRRLSPASSREIRRAILASPAARPATSAGLGWEWWQGVMSPLTIALTQAGRTSVDPQVSKTTGTVFVRPYLRLT